MLLLLAATTAGQAQQDLPYQSGSTGADGPLIFKSTPNPGKRSWHAVVYDGGRQELLMFGGFSVDSNNNPNDMWALAPDDNWVRKPQNMLEGRYGPAVAYDAARDNVVLFGGHHISARNETFTWNGTNWNQRSPSQSPSTRYHTRAVFDSLRQQTVLFGGYNNGVLGETWLWNGTNWTRPTLAIEPSARYVHDMAFDSARGEVVLFGGYTGSTNLADTWVWNGTNWSMKTPQASPTPHNSHQMAYDPIRRETVMFGTAENSNANETWVWNGTNWAQRFPAVKPPVRYAGSMSFHASREKIVLFGGYDGSRYLDDTWTWDGANWTFISSRYFDMRGRSNGLWNFTTIDLPGGQTVEFIKNAANSPVRWLASSNVTINGTLELSGQNAPGTQAFQPGSEAIGGPGGYNGGLGGRRFIESGSYAGTAGQGPGGGAAGTTSNAGGQAANSSYINSYLQPLIGGSGGGGQASTDTGHGWNGGAGGGAILIASSRDIVVNGSIRANGGSGANNSGQGSGGAIRLVADRVTINGAEGSLSAIGPSGGTTLGKIRVEAYYRTGPDRGNPDAISSAPVPTQAFETNATLLITSVAGENVAEPPTGNTLTPDVVFTQAGPISVAVQSVNVPDTSPVTLRVTTNGQLITATTNLAGGLATFTVTVPKGIGTIQASASFTINSP